VVWRDVQALLCLMVGALTCVIGYVYAVSLGLQEWAGNVGTLGTCTGPYTAEPFNAPHNHNPTSPSRVESIGVFKFCAILT
jgi:hypothetical protein